MRNKKRREARKGVIAPLMAILAIPLVAMVAFSVDLGYVVEARLELKNVSDSASMAGAQQLYPAYSDWQTALTSTSKATIMSNAITIAKNTATAVAAANTAGGVSITLLSADIDVGYTDSSGNYYSSSSIPSGYFPNTVVVTARRDSTANNPVGLFFGTVLGKSSMAVTQTSTATAYESSVTNLTSTSGTNSSLLPFAVDQYEWSDFYTNGSTSQYHDSKCGGLNICSDHTCENYGSISGGGYAKGGYPSVCDGSISCNGSSNYWFNNNWGNNSTSNFTGSSGWIQAGPTSSDISGMHSSYNLPLPCANTSYSNCSAGPQLTYSNCASDCKTICSSGSTKLLPLYDASGCTVSNGSVAAYKIVAIVPVIMTSCVKNTSCKNSNMSCGCKPACSPCSDTTAVTKTSCCPLSSSGTCSSTSVSISTKTMINCKGCCNPSSHGGGC